MFWLFLSSREQRKVQTAQGYFNCPTCAGRRPCALLQMETRSYLYGFIPMPGSEITGPESYRCLMCNDEWAPDGVRGFDFGEHLETQTWKCFRCGKEVAYESFECPHCGYRLEVGRPW